MGKITRRGSAAVAVAAAATLALAPSALAQGDDDGPNLYRFAGKDRIATSISAAERGSFNGDTIIVANSEDFPDALAAAPLADALNAPVILDKPERDEPSQQVAAYGQRLLESESGVVNVILASGTDVFSNEYKKAIEDNFETLDSATRVAGANRYETAVELSKRAVEEGGIEAGDVNVFLADGKNFADALAAGPAAANNSGVVLLSKGSSGIDSQTFEALSDNASFGDHNSIIAVGGPASAGAANGFDNDPVELDDRKVGVDRYETATKVAGEYFADSAKNFVLTSGEDFSDAVVGGAYAANRSAPLLLTRQTHLTEITGNYLAGSKWINGYMFGGPVALSEDVAEDLAGLWTD